MQVEYVPIDDLKPASYNPRQLSHKEEEDLTESLITFGFAEPIVVNSYPARKNIIIGGHQRWTIAKKLKIEKVPVVYISLDENKEKELNLRLNKNLGDWDYDLLKNLDKELLKDVGFIPEEIDKIYDIHLEEDDFLLEEQPIPTVKLGDLWQLGKHKLYCGDSTKSETFQKLMADEKAFLIFTDPPYNVDYDYGKYQDGRKMKWGKIYNDNLSSEDFRKFITDAFKNAHEYSIPEANYYCCFAMKNYTDFRVAIEAAGFKYSQTLIWLKDRLVLSLGQTYHRIYEPIMYGWKFGHWIKNHFWKVLMLFMPLKIKIRTTCILHRNR